MKTLSDSDLDKLRQFVEFVKNAPVGSGVCCCGSSLADHHWEQHSPVDQWDHALSFHINAVENILN